MISAKENKLHGNPAEAAAWIGFDSGDDGGLAADGGVAAGEGPAEFADGADGADSGDDGMAAAGGVTAGETADEDSAGCATGAEAGGDGMPAAGDAVAADEGAAEFAEGVEPEGVPEQPVNTAKMDATSTGARIRRGNIRPLWFGLVTPA